MEEVTSPVWLEDRDLRYQAAKTDQHEGQDPDCPELQLVEAERSPDRRSQVGPGTHVARAQKICDTQDVG